jgi:hypothetical protein
VAQNDTVAASVGPTGRAQVVGAYTAGDVMLGYCDMVGRLTMSLGRVGSGSGAVGQSVSGVIAQSGSGFIPNTDIAVADHSACIAEFYVIGKKKNTTTTARWFQRLWVKRDVAAVALVVAARFAGGADGEEGKQLRGRGGHSVTASRDISTSNQTAMKRPSRRTAPG